MESVGPLGNSVPFRRKHPNLPAACKIDDLEDQLLARDLDVAPPTSEQDATPLAAMVRFHDQWMLRFGPRASPGGTIRDRRIFPRSFTHTKK